MESATCDQRFMDRFSDPRFDNEREVIGRLARIAWHNHEDGRNPRLRESVSSLRCSRFSINDEMSDDFLAPYGSEELFMVVTITDIAGAKRVDHMAQTAVMTMSSSM